MTKGERYRDTSRLIGGALLMLVGGAFVLQNLGVLRAGRLGDYWPLLLVWIGLARILGLSRGHHRAAGVILLLLGVFFQLDRFELVPFSLREAWPALLVFAGLALILESLSARRRWQGELGGSSPADPGGRP